MIRWVIELGSIYITFEISDSSIYLAFPRTRHLLQALNLFKYLEIRNANDIAFDTCYQRVTSDQNIQSKVHVMKYFSVDAGKEIPSNAPKPRGKPVQVKRFVSSYHARDESTRRSQTGIILYCN